MSNEVVTISWFLVEVRFKEHGLESIEVVDNGCGIAAADYDSVGKYYILYLTNSLLLKCLSTRRSETPHIQARLV